MTKEAVHRPKPFALTVPVSPMVRVPKVHSPRDSGDEAQDLARDAGAIRTGKIYVSEGVGPQ